MPFWLTAGLVAGSIIATKAAVNKTSDDISFRRYWKQHEHLFKRISEDEFERIVHLSAKGLPRIQSVSTSL